MTPPGALAMLGLPRFQLLTDAQLRGVTCVWCGIHLTPTTARDLGPRPRPTGGHWYPRGCTRCIRATARRVITLHDETCARCTPGRDCEARTALRGLIREDRTRADH